MGVPPLPGRQQAELSPAEVQGWNQEPNCLPTDLDIGKKSNWFLRREEDISHPVLHPFSETELYFFVGNLSTHYIFHLFQLVFL